MERSPFTKNSLCELFIAVGTIFSAPELSPSHIESKHCPKRLKYTNMNVSSETRKYLILIASLKDILKVVVTMTLCVEAKHIP